MTTISQNKIWSPNKPLFWGILGLTSLLGIALCIWLFPRAIPIVALDLRMNRGQALEAAQDRAKQLHLGPSEFNQVASFDTDQTTKTYVELDAGGITALENMIAAHIYEPYTWHVRQFKEGSEHEVSLFFTPQGTPYGFIERFSEKEAGAELATQEARAIAEKHAAQDWGINFADYKHIESSQETKLSKRIDHIFVYEHINEKLGEGLYRLRLVVSGDKLTQLTHFFKVPEEFLLRYREIRSANNGVAVAASLFYFLVYLLGCCGIGIMILGRSHQLIWKQGIIAALIVGIGSLLASLNQLPLMWLYYDTALSMQQFFLSIISRNIYSAVFNIAMLIAAFIAAEGLTRRAFGKHPQLWQVWSKKGASSLEILGRTIGGYLVIGIHLGFVIGTYYITTRYFGWWVPSDHLADPNILATYFPWLGALTMSLQAGFMEECVFRAVPLATAALLGDRFGKRNWWITGAFIIQAIVFGAAHANYPALPAYARLLELIIPSCLFGGIYLIWGLLPSIISHVLFDVVWFSLPLFVSQAPDAWMHQAIIIVCAALPFLIVIIRRMMSKSWHHLAASLYNSGWQQPEIKKTEQQDQTHHQQIHIFSAKHRAVCVLVSIIGLALWSVGLIVHKQDAPGLTITRDQAITIARKALEQKGIQLGSHYQPIASAITNFAELHSAAQLQHKFVWQEGGIKERPLGETTSYNYLVGSYLTPARWTVRFVTFEGDVNQRAEEYQVTLIGNGTITRINHVVPEKKQGPQLAESDARIIAHQALINQYNLDMLEEISAQSFQRPERRDWVFTFADNTAFNEHGGQARVVITVQGDEISDMYRIVHVPEEWQREQRSKEQTFNLIKMFLLFLALVSMGFLLQALKNMHVRFLHIATSIGLFFALLAIQYFNLLPQMIGGFNTAEPFSTQLFINCGLLLFSTLILSVLFGFGSVASSQTIDNHKFKNLKLTTLASLTIASLCAGIWSLYVLCIPSTVPSWGNYSYLTGYNGFVALLFGAIIGFITTTIIILLTTNALNFVRRKYNIATLVTYIICIVGTIMFTGIMHITSISQWLLTGLVGGIIVGITYFTALSKDARVAVYLAGMFTIMKLLQQNITNAGMVPGVHVTIIVVGLLTYWWASKLSK